MNVISAFARKKVFLVVLVLLITALIAGCGPDKTFGFQFMLKDSSGNPINGTKDVTVKLYHKDIFSNFVEDFSETHTGVSVVNGLANLEIGDVNNNDSDPNNDLDPAIFAQPLWLEVNVGGEVLSPKQKLLGSPYAMTLVGGAVVSSGYESTEPNYPSLSIANTSTGNVLGLGTTALGDGDFINACDEIDLSTRDCPTKRFTLKNDGSIYTMADTVINAHAYNFVTTNSAHQYTLAFNSYGYARFRPSATGTSYAYLPVDVPNQLLGTPMKLRNVRVCYDLDNASSYITEVSAYYSNESLARTVLFYDTSDLKSTTTTCKTITASTPHIINGSVFLKFVFSFAGTGSTHDISIGKVTLTLTED